MQNSAIKFFFLIVWGVLFAAPSFVEAQNVTVDADVSLQLPSDNTTYTLKSGSAFNALSVGGATISVTGSQSGSVDIRSGDKKDLSNTRNITVTCLTSESQLVIPANNGDTVVTPSGSCGGGGGGGTSGGGGGSSGGGGGGGYGSSYIAPTTVSQVALLKQQIADTQAKISQKLSQAGAAPSMNVISSLPSRTLNPGQRNDQVKLLQQALAKDPELYPEATVSGYFGPATARAVQKFQLKYGLIASAKDSASGKFGPKTKAKFEEVFGKAASILVPPAPVATPVSPTTPGAPAVAPATVQQIQEQIKALQAKILQAQVKVLQDKINSLKK